MKQTHSFLIPISLHIKYTSSICLSTKLIKGRNQLEDNDKRMKMPHNGRLNKHKEKNCALINYIEGENREADQRPVQLSRFYVDA